MPRGRAVRYGAVGRRHAKGFRSGGPPEFSDRRGQRSHAHQAAAFAAGFVMVAGGFIGRRLDGAHGRCGDLMHVRFVVGMSMIVRIRWSSYRVFVDMDRPPTVFAFGQAGCGSRTVAECEGGARSDDAKQIGQRDEASGLQSCCFGKPDQHQRLVTPFAFSLVAI